MLKQFAIIIALIALVLLGCELWTLQLRDLSFLTGWILVAIGSIIALLLIIRHHGSSPTLKHFYHSAHLVLGWTMLYVFLLHIEFQMPGGLIERIMATLFIIICLSGVCSILFHYLNSRQSLSNTLNTVPQNEIPLHRRRIAQEVATIVVNATEIKGDTQLADFYQHHLQPYFSAIPPKLATLFGQQKQHKILLQKLQKQTNLLPSYQNSLDEIRNLILKKSTLDYQSARDSFQSSWYLLHKYITYSILGFVALHILLVYVFSG